MALPHHKKRTFSFKANCRFIAKKISERAPHTEAIGRPKPRAVQNHPPYASLIDYGLHGLAAQSNTKNPFR